MMYGESSTNRGVANRIVANNAHGACHSSMDRNTKEKIETNTDC
jgi:hypothetical protein